MSTPLKAAATLPPTSATKRKPVDGPAEAAPGGPAGQDENEGKGLATDQPAKRAMANILVSELTWVEKRAIVLRQSLPHIRFRATQDLYGKNKRADLESQEHRNVIVILIRGLAKFKNVITALQRCKTHREWGNEYIAHLSPDDALKLPSFDGRTRGVFYGTKGAKCAYTWNVKPIRQVKVAHQHGWFLRLKAHVPLSGPISQIDTPAQVAKKYPLLINQGTVENPRLAKIACSSFKHNGDTINGNSVFNRDFTYVVTEISTGLAANKFWTGKSETLLGQVLGFNTDLKVTPACETCGCEKHTTKDCIFANLLTGSVIAIEILDDPIMEVSPKRRVKKKTRISTDPPAYHSNHQSLSCNEGPT
ncbi:hypothetical protein PTTG_01634 [Puccinia triticina 1-1 BBBD Race 1]|uniref:Uncharacterized protein n=1 Tax=Puccinia triticina (isolate 1-1 / race 1 (BBBD)) TaxID=630390 RepID=A0A180GS33_PUCT1|nr:hypothetical protein PTTG_01634 [Puccinia triticina 1-1 BBBD Race 1]